MEVPQYIVLCSEAFAIPYLNVSSLATNLSGREKKKTQEEKLPSANYRTPSLSNELVRFQIRNHKN